MEIAYSLRFRSSFGFHRQKALELGNTGKVLSFVFELLLTGIKIIRRHNSIRVSLIVGYSLGKKSDDVKEEFTIHMMTR